MSLDSLAVQDYRKFEHSPRAARNASSVQYRLLEQSNHSKAYRVEFRGEGTKVLFGKEFFHTTDPSPDYQEARDPNRLFMWELRSTKLITSQVGQNLVPTIVGYSPEQLILLFEFLDGPSDRELLLQARSDADEAAKKDLVYKRARNIAIFDGRLQARATAFATSVPRQTAPSSTEKARQIADYLRIIVGYAHRKTTPSEEIIQSSERFAKFVESHYHVKDLFDKVNEVVQHSVALQQKYVLQHGDCRVQHAIGERLVDLGNLGYHPQGYDLVTYLHAEGGISELGTASQLPQLLGYFLAYEKEAKRDADQRRKGIAELDLLGKEDIARRIRMEDRLPFIANFLAIDIEESLHLDACNKRYPASVRAEIIGRIPGYTEEEMMQRRLENIEEAFGLVKENNLLWGHLPQASGIRDYFYHFADLLQRLEIIHLEQGVLDRIRADTPVSVAVNGSGNGKS